METLLLVPVDDSVVFPTMTVTLSVDVGDEERVLLVPREDGEFAGVGTVAEVAERVRRRAPDAAVHTDAVQAAAWLPLADRLAGTDLISISSHKVGGPQGVGALVARRGTPLRPLVAGGGQERELRSGTHDVAGIVGFAAALRAAAATRETTVAATRVRRDRLADGLLRAVPGLVETGPPRADRLPGTLHVCLPGVESEAVLFLLDEAGVCASAASACASGAQQASHVLAAMGVPPERARGALRLSLGWTTTDADVDALAAVIPTVVHDLRERALA